MVSPERFEKRPKKLLLRLSAADYRRLRALAHTMKPRRAVSALIREAVRRFLLEEGGE